MGVNLREVDLLLVAMTYLDNEEDSSELIESCSKIAQIALESFCEASVSLAKDEVLPISGASLFLP